MAVAPPDPAEPAQARLYRIAVAIAGLLLVCLGFVSGPIPGPGGIPLVLLGLAIWSSEFEWANRLMGWFKAPAQALPRLAPAQAGAVLGGLLRGLRHARLLLRAADRRPGLGARIRSR